MEHYELDKPVDISIVSYVHDNLPNDLTDKYEVAIAIYVLLCKLFKYDSTYVVCDTVKNFSIEDITIENNSVICYTFSAILCRLLCLYGINAKLNGSTDGHMYVSFSYAGDIVTLDATTSSFVSGGYKMSDITNVKCGFLPTGISSLPEDLKIGKFTKSKQKMYETIKNVYKKLGYKIDKSEKLERIVERIINKYDTGYYDEEIIDKYMSLINRLTFFDSRYDIENMQLLNKLTSMLFSSIWDERGENITLYKEDNRCSATKLCIIYDEDMRPYYFLFNGVKLVKYDKDSLYEVLVNEGWYFRYPADIDALDLKSDDKILKLYKQ